MLKNLKLALKNFGGRESIVRYSSQFAVSKFRSLTNRAAAMVEPENKNPEMVRTDKTEAESSSDPKLLTLEELEKKKKKEEKAREKELKKIKAAQKAEAAKLQAQQTSNASKAGKKKNSRREGLEDNPEDYVDPETPFGEKKRLSRQMAKSYNPSAVESSPTAFSIIRNCMGWGVVVLSLMIILAALVAVWNF